MIEIKVTKSDFVSGLTRGACFVGKKAVLPILENVKIKVKNDIMTFVSYNNENAISKKIFGVESSADYSFCVFHKDLLSYVKLISEEVINLCLSEEDMTITVKHSKGKMSFPFMDAADFPMIETDNYEKEIVVESAFINNWIVDAVNFIGNDELRPALNAMYFYSKDGKFGCCATDSISLFADYTDSTFEDFSFLLNKNVLSPICDMCKSVSDVKIKISNKNIMLVGNNETIISRCIDGRFLNFESVIPKNTPMNVEVDKKELSSAIARCGIVASQTTMLLEVNIKGATMEVIGQDVDFNKKATETLFVTSNGDIRIGLKATVLQTVIKCMNTDRISISMTDGSRPCVVREIDGNNTKMCLLMPMILN